METIVALLRNGLCVCKDTFGETNWLMTPIAAAGSIGLGGLTELERALLAMARQLGDGLAEADARLRHFLAFDDPSAGLLGHLDATMAQLKGEVLVLLLLLLLLMMLLILLILLILTPILPSPSYANANTFSSY